MKHGTNCDCAICSIGKKIGIIKKSDNNTTNCESCGAEKNNRDEDCCKVNKQ